MTQTVLGCIADDFTGATDLANNLVRAGMRVVQTIGVPSGPLDGEADAVVVALKSRTIPAADAVQQSLQALQWLQGQGCRQFYFKYCSTFDSTAEGNIGPVTDALMDALGTDFTIACPAFPENGRTVFKGHLFVGDELLQESGMRNHPLTPMRDSNLIRVLQAQTQRRVGLIEQRTVAQGEASIAQRVAALRSEGVAMAIVDAISNADLMVMGRAFADLPLLTAGSGVAIGLPQNFGIKPAADAARLAPPSGLRAIVSGSCSTATNAQVAHFLANGGEGFAIDPLQLAEGVDLAAQALDWASSRIAAGPVLVYATAEPASVKAIQAQLGSARAGEIVEHALAAVARGLVERGVGQLIVAGGETSGACVQALDIRSMRIGPQIAPGVPWCHAASGHAGDGALHIALKSGNFGATDFFTSAFRLLD
ncbi:four-carbon acid sugar kinase family protein [Variovorax sp. J22R133]|uniref:3-oxo-tetronate kinase n=1 Tax=Variovorax brevis TaxID=3053503 RepID=UPI0025774666|nr:3-oxo-tetronate kinase [Variovorax sp. J22R133]MDM0114138.1 four-carbon acid sugar kinase family protein [Variovorax sp. J22R133]